MREASLDPKDVAERYFVCIRSRDIDSVISLHDEDATFVLPNGRQFLGVAAIREMHLGVFSAGAPMPFPVAMVIGENSIAVEIVARLPDGTTRHTANFYQLNNEGRILRLSVYMHSG